MRDDVDAQARYQIYKKRDSLKFSRYADKELIIHSPSICGINCSYLTNKAIMGSAELRAIIYKLCKIPITMQSRQKLEIKPLFFLIASFDCTLLELQFHWNKFAISNFR